jgi:hypothetical protein
VLLDTLLMPLAAELVLPGIQVRMLGLIGAIHARN